MENKRNNAAVGSPDGLNGIATLTNDPLATYTLHGGRPMKRDSRK